MLLDITGANFESEWKKFKRDYNKQYATVAEEIKRRDIFIENVKEMYSYQNENPNATFTMAINDLLDRRFEVIVVRVLLLIDNMVFL